MKRQSTPKRIHNGEQPSINWLINRTTIEVIGVETFSSDGLRSYLSSALRSVLTSKFSNTVKLHVPQQKYHIIQSQKRAKMQGNLPCQIGKLVENITFVLISFIATPLHRFKCHKTATYIKIIQKPFKTTNTKFL